MNVFGKSLSALAMSLSLSTHAIEANSDLASTISKDYSTPREAALSLRRLGQELRKRGDRRSLFPNVYTNTISAATKMLDQRQFYNPKWVRSLIVNYANLYRRTIYLELTRKRSSVPVAWQMDFGYIDATSFDAWSPALDMVYGINVHIARDLVEALYVTPTDFSNPYIRADYFRINEAMENATPAIWKAFESYGDPIGLPSFFEQGVVLNWVIRLRAEAWDNAVSTARFGPKRKRAFLHQLDLRAAQMARDYGLALPLN